uniref:Uncharacterized protein n=1 Tax=Branchiostoma floridae TaxID=7739 RepID=C3YDC2_BRAFL|eukprot:XP_002605723.1 hypothetical protein BRAFLDRAFT_77990 [Branchiostoma floridae]
MATSRPHLPGSLHPRSADDKRLKGREVESGKDRLTVEVPADLRGETVLVIERKMLPQLCKTCLPSSTGKKPRACQPSTPGCENIGRDSPHTRSYSPVATAPRHNTNSTGSRILAAILAVSPRWWLRSFPEKSPATLRSDLLRDSVSLVFGKRSCNSGFPPGPQFIGL